MIVQHIKTQLAQQIELEIAKEKRKTGKISDKKVAEIKAEFEFSAWRDRLFESLTQVQEVGISLATHTAKGIHSSSKSSNLIVQPQSDVVPFVHSYAITSPQIDANNNNPAVYIKSLTLTVEFLNIWADKERFHQLIVKNNDEIKAFFEQYLDLASFEFLKNALLTNIDNAKIGERDKQILFPIGDDEYHTLFPVYPSSLAHELFIQISDKKFNENNRLARENRSKQNVSQQSYFSIHDLAFVKLGGTKPLNVSVLNNKQGGRNYLLPSLPPMFKGLDSIAIPKHAKSIFELKVLDYQARFQLQGLFEIIKTTTNNVKIRDARKATLDEMVHKVFEIAIGIQNNRPRGWSKEYPNLKMAEKYWLDPHRAELEDEEEFKRIRELGDWRAEIEIAFSEWLQRLLKLEFRKIAHEFGEPEQYEWRDEFKDEIKKSLRLGNGVF